MKAIFIALIVTGFLVPLLIGGGYKISELLEKSMYIHSNYYHIAYNTADETKFLALIE